MNLKCQFFITSYCWILLPSTFLRNCFLAVKENSTYLTEAFSSCVYKPRDLNFYLILFSSHQSLSSENCPYSSRSREFGKHMKLKLLSMLTSVCVYIYIYSLYSELISHISLMILFLIFVGSIQVTLLGLSSCSSYIQTLGN